jgi:WD40 repeat protein
MRAFSVGPARVHGLDFGPGGTSLVVVTASKTSYEGVFVWDLTHGHLRRHTPVGERLCWAVAVSPDRRLVAMAFGVPGLGRSHVRVDAIADGPPVRLPPPRDHPRFCSYLAFGWDGRTLALVNMAEVRLWDLTTGEELPPLPAPPAVTALDLSPDGLWVATGHADRSGMLWSLPERRPVARRVFRAVPRGVVFAPDGRTLALGVGHAVALWDVPGGRPRCVVKARQGMVNNAAFAPDGRTLLTAGQDGTVAWWDANTGAERARLDWGLGTAGAVAFAPDGLTAACGGDHGRVVLWDV